MVTSYSLFDFYQRLWRKKRAALTHIASIVKYLVTGGPERWKLLLYLNPAGTSCKATYKLKTCDYYWLEWNCIFPLRQKTSFLKTTWGKRYPQISYCWFMESLSLLTQWSPWSQGHLHRILAFKIPDIPPRWEKEIQVSQPKRKLWYPWEAVSRNQGVIGYRSLLRCLLHQKPGSQRVRMSELKGSYKSSRWLYMWLNKGYLSVLKLHVHQCVLWPVVPSYWLIWTRTWTPNRKCHLYFGGTVGNLETHIIQPLASKLRRR